ncbi:MAG: vWA domain-containing protein [Bacteroidota bacterium]
MEIRTVLLIILAAIVALAIVFYQYLYNRKKTSSLNLILAGLRFLSLLGAFLLLINPKFTKREYFLEKTNLVLLLDGSSSMTETGETEEIREVVNALTQNSNIVERFDVHPFIFGSDLVGLDSISFRQKNTDISNAIDAANEVFVSAPKTFVLISDGNQTLGKDYGYTRLDNDESLHAIAVGDTTQYQDISIDLVNSNTYAFLKNKFPVEARIRYKGTGAVSRQAIIAMGGKTLHRETVTLNAVENSQTIQTLIEADQIGIKSIRVSVETLENERNTANNTKETAIEVIDEKTNVGIVSDFLHPDIGALKKSIESNEQRSVTLLKPSDSKEKFEAIDIFILYQPNRRFADIYDYLQQTGISRFTITGTKTDWGFLNQVQTGFFMENLNQSEEIIPVLNNVFKVFGLGDFSVDGFPPLQGSLGDVEFKTSGQTILFQKIRGVNLEKPLFSVLTEGNRREAVLFGENLWKWRAQTFRNSQDFSSFDDFIGKLMVYLGSDSRRSRLELDFNLIFTDASLAKIRASFFDESYAFDPNANLKITIKGQTNDFFREAPMLVKGSFYQIDLSDLPAGAYEFTVVVENQPLKRSGSFQILDFNPEKQYISTNYTKLKRLAENNNGEVYLLGNVEELLRNLTESPKYLPIQKSKQNVVSLIDFRVLLGIIAFTLALEWFIRKYNGLI